MTNEKTQSDPIDHVPENLAERIDTFNLETIKGLILLNSGALVAMLAFTQAVALRPQWHAFKGYGLFALLWFGIGALAGPAALFIRTQSLWKLRYRNTRLSEKWWLATFIPIAVSLGALLVGGIAILAGLNNAF
jgi:hypothetical protein